MRMIGGPLFEKYGVQRTVRDALQIDGCVTISADGRIQDVTMNERHPLAPAFRSAFQG
jgi:hypothetical protein